MIEPRHLLLHVIRPTLKELDLWSEPAERLLLGTACQESHCGQWLVQLGGGPGLGIYQVELATHDDLFENFLRFRPELQEKIWAYITDDRQTAQEMIGNLYYATAICRAHYLRAPGVIPDYLYGQAVYWKQYFNTVLGNGTVQEYMNNWNRFVTPSVLI